MAVAALTRAQKRTADVPDDLIVLDNDLVFIDGQDQLDHLWLELVEREDCQEYHTFKVIKLAMLRYLPQEVRKDAGLVAKQRAALVGLYNSRARFDLVHLVAGVFDPAIGVLQCYGVVSSEDALEEAQHQAYLGMSALQGVLANYAQARFLPLDVKVSAWLLAALAEMPHALVVVGHPDPRENARGGGRESPDEPGKGNGRPENGVYTQQQNELLYRGLSALEEEFVWLLIAHRVDQGAVARMLAGIAGEASVWASRISGVKGISFGLSVPIMLSGALGRSAGTGFGESEGRTSGRSVGETEGRAHTEGEAETTGYAKTTGTSHAVGVAHTSGSSSGTTRSSSWSVSESEGTSRGTSDTEGNSESWGTAHTEGQSSTSGGSSTHTSSSTHVPAVATRSGGVTSVPEVTSRSATHAPEVTSSGETHTPRVTSVSVTDNPEVTTLSETHHPEVTGQGSTAVPVVTSGSLTHHPTTVSEGATQSAGQNAGVNLAVAGVGVGTADSISASQTRPYDVTSQASTGAYTTESQNTTPAHVTQAESTRPAHAVQSQSATAAHTTQSQNTTPAHTTQSEATTPAHQITSSSWSVTPAHTINSSSSSRSSFSSNTRSSADTTSQSQGVSESHTDSEGTSKSTTRSTGGGTAVSSSHFSSTTNSESWGEMESETRSWAKTRSRAETVSHATSRGIASGSSYATVLGRSLGTTRSLGLSGGVIPTVTASKSYNWTDDAAAQVTQMLRVQEEMLRQASLEGAYLTDVYVLTRTDPGRAAAEALVRQAFHGVEDVVTGVMARHLLSEEQAYIRTHALAFTPSTRLERIPGLLEGYKDATFLTMLQLAAYTAPGLFERGTAITTQERVPPFAFMPDMKGDAVLAHLFDTETGKLTDAQVRISEDRHMHTAFIGDTGFGKTVAAERLCYETAVEWHHRNIVLDFGAGWRRMLNAPLNKTRVDIWQLYPGAVRPLRWNPLQIGRRIPADRQLRATAELFANAGQMGPRQLGFMRRALRALYADHGVLTSDREVLQHKRWGVTQPGEEAVINDFRREKGLQGVSVPTRTYLTKLGGVDRQALAIHRSKQVDMIGWYEVLAGYKPDLQRKRDYSSLTSLEGVLLRLDAFISGEMALMYSKGEGTTAIEDLGLLGPPDDPWGIAVLEGGAEMDEYAKATLLGLIAWHLYNDAVVRRRESVGASDQKLPLMNIFWEEANKVLGGIAAGPTGGNDEAARSQTTALFQAMWRDGRKYGVFSHIVLQTVSEVAPGISSSCNNVFIGQTKAIKDRDLVLAHLAKSEKGFTDEEYKRFVSRMPRAMAICKLGFGWETYEMEAMLARPIMLPAQEPTDAELGVWYQRVDRIKNNKGGTR